MDLDLVKDEDLVPASRRHGGSSKESRPSLSRKDSMMSPTVHSPTTVSEGGGYFGNAASDEYAGLSKRQLNQLKRKNKQNAKMGSSKIRLVDLAVRKGQEGAQSSPPPPSSPMLEGNGNGKELALTTPRAVKKEEDDYFGAAKPGAEYFSLDREGNDDESKLVKEFKGPVVPEKPFIQSETEEQGLEWPYERMCEFLMVDLFDPAWEIRHGAAMGLREVVRVQGRGAGREYGKTRAENDAANMAWLNDLACRLVCVFLLDRFGDFISDNVVAPIRETVGQTL
ncbi:TATA-binding protein-associated factor mot1, partial [Ascosphaera atra]